MNLFRNIKSQNRALSILKNAIMHERIAQGYLFHGADGTGKFTTAFYFGMAVNCHSSNEFRPCGECSSCKKFLNFSHPDFVHIFPTPNMTMSETGEIKEEKYLKEFQAYQENKKKTPWKEFHFSGNVEIRIGSIRMLQHKINRSRSEARYKVYIVEHADLLNNKAANAFLKTLEEPPPDSLLLLTTSRMNKLLPTIISRCQQVPFSQLPRHVIEQEIKSNLKIDELQSKIFARIANGNMEKAMSLAEEGDIESRNKMLHFVDLIIRKDELKMIEFVETYRSSKQVSEINEIITHMIGWISDLALFYDNPEQIANVDQIEKIQHCLNKNPGVVNEIVELVEFLEEMKYRLNGNVRPQLILQRIYDKLTEKI